MAESKKSAPKSKTTTKRTAATQTKKVEPKAKAKTDGSQAQTAKNQTTNGSSNIGREHQDNKAAKESSPENIGDKLSGMAQKVFEAIKFGAEKVSDYASETSHLTKLKIEISNIKAERKKVFAQMGDKIWQLHKTKKLDKAEESFKTDFNKIENLETQITAKEKEIDSFTKISSN